MGHLTTGIKTYVGTGTIAAEVILDSGEDANFPHRGKNCHHLILANPASGKAVNIEYSFDGTNYSNVYAGTANTIVLWDTGSLGQNGGGGGSTSCPPLLVRVSTDSGTSWDSLQVRTYGSTVR